MRRFMYSLAVLGVGLGVTLLARERRAPEHAGAPGPASRQLMAEHQVILEVLRVAQAEADHIRRGFPMEENRVRDILDFSRNFTDRCHHGKEERYYFPATDVYRGPRIYSLIDELTAEHAYGRSILDEIDFLLNQGGDQPAKVIAERLSTYASLLDRHIRTENERLYQRASTFLSNAEEQALMVGFDRLEAELGAGFHERYHQLAEDLISGAGLLSPSRP